MAIRRLKMKISELLQQKTPKGKSLHPATTRMPLPRNYVKIAKPLYNNKNWFRLDNQVAELTQCQKRTIFFTKDLERRVECKRPNQICEMNFLQVIALISPSTRWVNKLATVLTLLLKRAHTSPVVKKLLSNNMIGLNLLSLKGKNKLCAKSRFYPDWITHKW